MKKVLSTILLAVLFASVNAQEKKQEQPKDTTIAVTLNINQFRALLAVIDNSIDSKKTSKEILDFLQQNARMVNPTTDWNKKAQEAAKEIEKPKEKAKN